MYTAPVCKEPGKKKEQNNSVKKIKVIGMMGK